MKTTILILLLGLSILGKAQIDLTKQQIKAKTDSILIEGELLFQYEKAAWISIDLSMEKESIQKHFNGYLVYQQDDTIKTIIINKDNQCIYELDFIKDYSMPIKEEIVNRELTENENELLTIRDVILNQITDEKYEVGCPDEYSLNFVLIPIESGYKFYILTGTSMANVIPFGNDYLFLTDTDGEVISMHKFHSRLIPIMTKGPNGEVATMISHSHLRSEPFISATDICTFKLYGHLYGLTEFSVYSPAFSKYFIYKAKNNKIKMADRM